MTTTNQWQLWDTGFFPCEKTNCCCTFSNTTRTFRNVHTNIIYPIVHRLSCDAIGVIYLIQCGNCSKQYIGETSRKICDRIKEHLADIRSGDRKRSNLANHFNSEDCNINSFHYFAIERCPEDYKRLKRETHWIKKLKSFIPNGLNGATYTKFNETNLIIPFSDCSQRIANMIKHNCRNLTDTKAVFTKHQSLKSILK